MERNSPEKWKQLQRVSIETISREQLADIDEIQIPEGLTAMERAACFKEQIKNPYCYRQGNYVVKLTFQEEGESITERLESYIRNKMLYGE